MSGISSVKEGGCESVAEEIRRNAGSNDPGQLCVGVRREEDVHGEIVVLIL